MVLSVSIPHHVFFLTERCVVYYRVRMQRTVTRYRVLLAALAIVFGFAASIFSPSVAAAEEYRIEVVTAPVFASSICPALPVASFTPYIYEGKLHSFDFTLGGPLSYVPILGSAGNTSFGFTQFSRVSSVPGKFHADISPLAITSSFPISISLLSPGPNTCLSIISIYLLGSSGSTPVSAPPSPARGVSYETPTTVVSHETTEEITTGKPDGYAPVVAGGLFGSMFGGIGHMSDYCKMGGAARVWIFLIALYAIFLALLVLYREKLPQVLRSDEALSVMIVGPFLLLFAVWYIAPLCRAATWVPFFATALAIGALLVAFRASISNEAGIEIPQPSAEIPKPVSKETPKDPETPVIHLPEAKK